MLNATKIIGYTIDQSVIGTVRLTVNAITIFNNQTTTSADNLTGLLCQSLRIKSQVLTQLSFNYSVRPTVSSTSVNTSWS